MPLPTPITYMIALGEIVTIDIQKFMGGLQQFLLGKGVPEDAIAQALDAIIKNQLAELNKLKKGELIENKFVNGFCHAINTAFTGFHIDFNKLKFYELWRAMQPPYTQFQTTITHLKSLCDTPETKIVVYSFTNPMDMTELKLKLQQNNHRIIEHSEGFTINGSIEVHTTYQHQTDKLSLLEELIVAAREQHQQVLVVMALSDAGRIPQPVLQDDFNSRQQRIHRVLQAHKLISDKFTSADDLFNALAQFAKLVSQCDALCAKLEKEVIAPNRLRPHLGFVARRPSVKTIRDLSTLCDAWQNANCTPNTFIEEVTALREQLPLNIQGQLSQIHKHPLFSPTAIPSSAVTPSLPSP